MERILTKDLHTHIGKTVLLKGWVDSRRDHGKLIFFDVRDRGGIVQTVVTPKVDGDTYERAQNIRDEWVLAVEGEVKKRPEDMVNTDELNGDIEISIMRIVVLNTAKTLPYDVNDAEDTDENVRLKYRYLDLRGKRQQNNMRVRSEFVEHCRRYLFEKDFVEIETPLLTESTPEGSRDFVVPSRLHPGKFYALPQSPQQYKQLLMTSGFERYFQIARAVRDEDLRSDRGFEHSQIDLEMSFVEMDDVLDIVEGMIIYTAEKMGYTIKEKPFPRITYKDALERYGADKFDLRTNEEKEQNILAYAWVVEFPFFEKTDNGKWTFSHNPFSMPKEEHIDWLLAGKNIDQIVTQQYDLVCNGYESGGGSIRSHQRDVLEATYNVMGYSEEDVQRSIGHMLEAFEFGTPPHGGIALGIERNIMNLTGETSLKEVQAFPMTRGGHTAVMNAPKELSKKQLDELGIKIKPDTK